MAGYEDFSMMDRTVAKCAKHNRYQRCEYWEGKPINKLLMAIRQGYVPVGKDIRKVRPRIKNK